MVFEILITKFIAFKNCSSSFEDIFFISTPFKDNFSVTKSICCKFCRDCLKTKMATEAVQRSFNDKRAAFGLRSGYWRFSEANLRS